MNNHILIHYDEALGDASELIIELGRDIACQVDDLILLVEENDTKYANRVIAEIELLEIRANHASEACYGILNRFHPVASDLRLVIALSRCAEKMTASLEDLGSLARRGKAMKKDNPLHNTWIVQLLLLARKEFGLAVDSLEKKDNDMALEVKMKDKELDQRHKEVMDSVIEAVQKEEGKALDVNMLFFIRAVERMGDHAKALANAVLFMQQH